MSGAKICASIRKQEAKFGGHQARLDQAPSTTETQQPDLTSRGGSCEARLNEEDVMKQKFRCGFSRRSHRARTVADSSYIRVRTMLALETGYGARSATLTWLDAEA